MRTSTTAFTLLLLALVVAAVGSPAAHAQRIRPAFSPKLVRKMRVSGTVRFKIVARRDGLPHEFAPIGRNGWAAVVRVDGHAIGSVTRLPAVVEWDTRAAGDGAHEVLVSVRNARADQEVGVEGAQVIVDNASADSAAEMAEIARAAVARLARTQSGEAAPPEPVLSTPVSAKMTRVAARITASADPRAARATALLRSGSRLYLGLPDGGIAVAPVGGASRAGTVVRLPLWNGAVRTLAVGAGRVWWASEDGRAVYAYSDAARSVTRYDVTAAWVTPPPPPVIAEPPPPIPPVSPSPDAPAEPPAGEPTPPPASEAVPEATPPVVAAPEPIPVTPPKPTGWVRRVAVLRGRVLLLGDAATALTLDPQTGALGLTSELLPHNATLPQGDGPARLFVSAGNDARTAALVVSVTPSPLPPAPPSDATLAAARKQDGGPRWRRWQVRAWRSAPGGGEWKQIAAYASDADPDRGARLALSPDGLATAEREGPRLAAFGDDPRDVPYALSPGMPSSTDKLAVGPDGVLWWEQRGIVFRADPSTGIRDAFLPWNVPGGTGAVLALHPDRDGVWVATTTAGVRFLRPGRPNAANGYDGYVRARLGPDTQRPPSPRAHSVAAAIEEWQGVRYVWGGQSRSGADCSGFVMRMHEVGGVSIPRTSAQMRHSSAGPRIRSDLRWGDTLVYPGHVALYVGDGQTAETVGGSRDGSVSRSSVWVRSNVVIRRFLR